MAPELATTIDSSTSDNSGTTAAAAAALADDFFNRFNVSKLVENDPKRPHPKFSTYCRKFCSNSDDGVKRLQEKRRQELLENLKRYVFVLLSDVECNFTLSCSLENGKRFLIT